MRLIQIAWQQPSQPINLRSKNFSRQKYLAEARNFLFAGTLIFMYAGFIVASFFWRLRSSLFPGGMVAGLMIGPDVLPLIDQPCIVYRRFFEFFR